MPHVLCSHVDAFTAEAGRGNPAAVCFPTCEVNAEVPSASPQLSVPPDSWMQQVAADFGYPETAFVYPDGDQLRLRWFTPQLEVDLCGHATLATAFVMMELVQKARLPDPVARFWKHGQAEFHTRSGLLRVESISEGMTMDFPATPVTASDPPSGLLPALGLSSDDLVWSGRSKFDLFLHMKTAQLVRRMSPDMAKLSAIPCRGVIVTALGDTADHDFLSRFFAPASGIPEDPVTGSAHCALAPYWAPQFGRNILFGYQASQRGGHVRMDLRNDRVRLTGQAVIVSHSEVERG